MWHCPRPWRHLSEVAATVTVERELLNCWNCDKFGTKQTEFHRWHLIPFIIFIIWSLPLTLSGQCLLFSSFQMKYFRCIVHIRFIYLHKEQNMIYYILYACKMKQISHFWSLVWWWNSYLSGSWGVGGSARPPHPKTINLILCEKKYRARKTPDDLIRT